MANSTLFNSVASKAWWAVSNPIAAFTLASTASVLALSVTTTVAYLLLRTREYSSATSKIETDAIMKMLPKNTKWSRSEQYVPSVGWVANWVFSLRYCAKIKSVESQHGAPHYEITIWRFCFQSWEKFDAMIRPATSPQEATSETPPLPKFLDHIVRSSANLAWPWYSVNSKYAHLPGTPESELAQADAIARRALLQLNEIGSGVIMVCGPPATGKTSAGVRAAQLLGSNTVICTCLDPSRAGNLISEIIKTRDEHDPSATIIIIKNEIDMILDRLGSIPANAKLVTEVTDKSTWNDWLDDIHRCRNVVVWLTSNATTAKLATYDPSLLRKKRVTAHYRATGSDTFYAVHEQLVTKCVCSSAEQSGADSDSGDQWDSESNSESRKLDLLA